VIGNLVLRGGWAEYQFWIGLAIAASYVTTGIGFIFGRTWARRVMGALMAVWLGRSPGGGMGDGNRAWHGWIHFGLSGDFGILAFGRLTMTGFSNRSAAMSSVNSKLAAGGGVAALTSCAAYLAGAWVMIYALKPEHPEIAPYRLFHEALLHLPILVGLFAMSQ
jgi:hypothetical protein